MIKEKSKIIRPGFDELKEKNNFKRLAGKCLKYKWIEDQSKNLSKLMSPCVFCFECYEKKKESDDCSNCQIPKIICDDDGRKGLIGFIFNKYGNVFLKEIDKREYNLIRKALIELSRNGQISFQTKRIIEKLIT